MSILLETAYGDVVIDLDGPPELARNILKLAAARLYTQSLLYSIHRDQGMAYWGCPLGTGQGGASIHGYLDALQKNIAVDQSTQRFLRSSHLATPSEQDVRRKGRLFAIPINGLADTLGSQLALSLTDDDSRSFLATNGDNNKSAQLAVPICVGVVAEDDDGVLDKLAAQYTDEHHRPFVDLRIRRCRVIYDPYDDPPGMRELMVQQGVVLDDANDDDDDNNNNIRRIRSSPSPERPPTETISLRLSIEEVVLDDDEQDTPEAAAKRFQQFQELRRKEDKSRTVMLELLGDLPPTEMMGAATAAGGGGSSSGATATAISVTPPDTVLFICKLNPVTTPEDLELIFSRFDEKVRVDLIRDEQTMQSLQYAFAHFQTPQQATEAYLKMNQALVDDRRIIVDFCQSVSHVWDKYRQRLRVQPLGARANGSGGGGVLGTTMKRNDHDFSNYSRGGQPRDRNDGHRRHDGRPRHDGRQYHGRSDSHGRNHPPDQHRSHGENRREQSQLRRDDRRRVEDYDDRRRLEQADEFGRQPQHRTNRSNLEDKDSRRRREDYGRSNDDRRRGRDAAHGDRQLHRDQYGNEGRGHGDDGSRSGSVNSAAHGKRRHRKTRHDSSDDGSKVYRKRRRSFDSDTSSDESERRHRHRKKHKKKKGRKHRKHSRSHGHDSDSDSDRQYDRRARDKEHGDGSRNSKDDKKRRRDHGADSGKRATR